jgi:hypothetical protein
MMPYAAEAGPLWAVTSYFNPVGYRRRRENYRTFRQQLALPLAAIELSFNGCFELGPEDAEILIQIRGRDVMWQKERLLNAAIQALPAHCTQVAMLDCDVVFARPDWGGALSRRLDDCPLVQPFSTVHYPPPDLPLDSPQLLSGDFTRPGVGCLIEQGLSALEIWGRLGGVRRPGAPAPGHALAARRDWLLSHGLYDAAIIGGGDLLLLSAACKTFGAAVQRHAMNEAQAKCYLAWAEQLECSVRGEIGCVPGDLVHLWHGEMSNRRTVERYHELAACGFDPEQDIELDSSGCWRWSSDKPAMHRFVRDYFASRKEDGSECPLPSRSLQAAA